MDRILKDVYYNPKSPGSFGGKNALKTITKQNCEKWLQAQDTYTLHKPVRRKYARRKTFVVSIDHLWQCDLAELQTLSRYNDGCRYILFVIDCLSRYVWARAITRKTADAVTHAFADIIEKSQRKPVFVHTDFGSEFKSNIFTSFLRKNDITWYSISNYETKASLAERAIRTLKSRIYRWFTYSNTYRYIDVLQDIVDGYNNTYHRTIKCAPASVNVHNEQEIIERLYKPDKSKKIKFKFKIGDKVRISENKRTFEKGYLARWTVEHFVVSERLPSVPPTYRLSDLGGEEIKGRFYEPELQKIIKQDNIYKIEKVIKTRKRGNKKEHFVKWLGYDSTFNSWVTNLHKI